MYVCMYVCMYVIVISHLGGMYLSYSHKPEGTSCQRASDCKLDTSQLGML